MSGILLGVAILAMFVMATLGVALLIFGEVLLGKSKRIPAGRSRLIGVILLSFPLVALGVGQLVKMLLGPEVDGLIVTWSMFGVWWMLIGALLFRVLVPKKAPRPTSRLEAAVTSDPFGPADLDDDPAEHAASRTPPQSGKKVPANKTSPAKKPPASKRGKPSATDENPFDFT